PPPPPPPAPASITLDVRVDGQGTVTSTPAGIDCGQSCHGLQGTAEGGVLHLINSGPSALDWTGRQVVGGKPACKAFWEINPEDAGACLDNTSWCASDLGYFPGGGWSTDFTTEGGMPCTMCRINMVK